MTVTVYFTSALTKSFYLVHNRFGIIHSDFEQCEDSRKCKLYIKITKGMLPHVTVNVFGIASGSGKLVHGKFELEFEEQSENFVSKTSNHTYNISRTHNPSLHFVTL
jgi:hypothetical protein